VVLEPLTQRAVLRHGKKEGQVRSMLDSNSTVYRCGKSVNERATYHCGTGGESERSDL
jgi:hypothetical protein